MIRLLERSALSIDRRLVLLAPATAHVPAVFTNVCHDAARRDELVHEVQRLRGRIYLNDGAIASDQLSDGRHQTMEDEKSWHLLMMNGDGQVSSCVWYMEHDNTTRPEDLRVRNCPLATSDEWRRPLLTAVESELRRARRGRLRYAEVGGWAVSKTSRCTSEGLLLALGAYSLGRIFGGALGMTTATVRHSSSTILRRLGGQSLEANGTVVPSYFDPHYKCEMELLRFDSRRPNEKFSEVIEALRQKLASVLVISGLSETDDTSAGELPFAAAHPVFAA